MGDQQPADEDLDRLPTDQELGRLQWTTVLYDLHETNPDNWLVRDKTDPAGPSSIAAVGMALATIPVIVKRGVIIRKFAAKIARRRLRSLFELPQGPGPEFVSVRQAVLEVGPSAVEVALHVRIRVRHPARDRGSPPPGPGRRPASRPCRCGSR
jgi:hypothetical protein